jgi:release factor glutamine methyltransferase
MRTVGDALELARRLGVDRLDAQLLAAHAVDRPRTWVLANDDAPLGESQGKALREHLTRRADGEPLAYLIGEKEFHGLTLRVTPDVLIPRPDTETLVDWALECLASAPTKAQVLDLGTGSGAIALALAHACRDVQVCAVDASEAALAVARANGTRIGLSVQWALGDWFSPLGAREFALIVSNPPYVAERDPHLLALRHEPSQALCAGPDGLDAIRSIATQAPDHLLAQGWLLLEHAHAQASAVRDLLRQAGLRNVVTRTDLAGQCRCSGGQR